MSSSRILLFGWPRKQRPSSDLDKRILAAKSNAMPHETKGKPARIQKNVSRATKECGCENIKNRDTKQSKAAGEGLELVRGTKGSQSETTGTAAQNKIRSLEKVWNECVEQREVSRNTKETVAQNKTEPTGEGLELVRGQKEVNRKTKGTAAANKKREEKTRSKHIRPRLNKDLRWELPCKQIDKRTWRYVGSGFHTLLFSFDGL